MLAPFQDLQVQSICSSSLNVSVNEVTLCTTIARIVFALKQFLIKQQDQQSVQRSGCLPQRELSIAHQNKKHNVINSIRQMAEFTLMLKKKWHSTVK